MPPGRNHSPAGRGGGAVAWAAAWAAIGLILIAGFLVYVSAVEGGADGLRQTGVRTTAVALEDSPVALKCSQVPVRIRYSVDKVARTDTLWVEGCGGALRQGQQVTLYVDPADPTRFVTDGSSNEKPFAVWAAIGALLGGPVLLISAAVRMVRLVRVRRVLTTAGWVPGTASIVSVPGKLVRSSRVLVTSDDEQRVLLKLPFTLGDNDGYPPVARTRVVLACRSERRWAVAHDQGKRPVAVTELRTGRLHDKVIASIRRLGL